MLIDHLDDALVDLIDGEPRRRRHRVDPLPALPQRICPPFDLLAQLLLALAFEAHAGRLIHPMHPLPPA
jgi:hypothetical protein